MIKVALCLARREIPPTINFRTPNPAIPFGPLNLQVYWWGSKLFFYFIFLLTYVIQVQTELTPWPATGGAPARGAVNSFGFGGTNAHAILQEAPATAQTLPPVEGNTFLLPITAHSAETLRVAATKHAKWLTERSNHFPKEEARYLADYCYTAGVRRTHMKHRLVVAGKTTTDIISSLTKYLTISFSHCK